MRAHWWKFLGVLLVAYGIVAGMLVPLKPNVWRVTPTSAKVGESVTLAVVGYNTQFLGADAGAMKGWIIAGKDLSVAATDVAILDDRRVDFTFDIPAYLPSLDVAINEAREYSLFVSSSNDGTFAVPRAITLRQLNAPPTLAAAERAWKVSAMQEGDLFPSTKITFPYRGLLGETIRNTYFHVSLWFAMMFVFIAGFVYAITYLNRSRKSSFASVESVSPRDRADYWSVAFTSVGMTFGILGLLTGAVWAKYTWGTWWSWDIKQFTTLVALLIYAGYFILRAALPDPEQKARLSAPYNVFAFICLIPLIYIIPRVAGNSLHPGAAGNPALGGEDLDSTMRMVFYPIIIGWTLFGFWMAGIHYRIRVARERLQGREATV